MAALEPPEPIKKRKCCLLWFNTGICSQELCGHSTVFWDFGGGHQPWLSEKLTVRLKFLSIWWITKHLFSSFLLLIMNIRFEFDTSIFISYCQHYLGLFCPTLGLELSLWLKAVRIFPRWGVKRESALAPGQAPSFYMQFKSALMCFLNTTYSS